MHPILCPLHRPLHLSQPWPCPGSSHGPKTIREKLPFISFQLFLSGVQTSLASGKSVELAAWLRVDTEVKPSSQSQSRSVSVPTPWALPHSLCVHGSHGAVRCPGAGSLRCLSTQRRWLASLSLSWPGCHSPFRGEGTLLPRPSPLLSLLFFMADEVSGKFLN